MNKQRLISGIALALLISALVVATVGAMPTERAIEAVECTIEVIEPGREWVDEYQIYHLRGRVVKNIKVSDYALLNGMDIVEINLNLDLVDGSGDGFGSGEFQPNGVNGTFRGRWTGVYNSGLLTGRVVNHGTGDLQPMRGEATFEQITDPAGVPCEGWEPLRLVGVITDPLGRNLD